MRTIILHAVVAAVLLLANAHASEMPGAAQTNSVATLGLFAIPPQFDDAAPFHEGLAAVLVGGMWGFVDETGKMVIAPQFKHVKGDRPPVFFEGLCSVRLGNGKSGFINKEGQTVISPQYDSAAWFSEGLAAVEKDHKFGFIDHSGKVVIPFQFEAVSHFTDGVVAAHIGGRSGKWRLIDKAGKTLGEFGYIGWQVTDGLVPVKLDGGSKKMGYVDNTGKLVIELPPGMRSPGYFSEGLASFRTDIKGGRYGFIDKTGKVVIPARFTKLSSEFRGGLASVANESGKFGYIDRNGTMVISTQFEEAHAFRNGLAAVKIAGKDGWGFINQSGGAVVSPRFENLSDEEFQSDSRLTPAKVGGKYGFIYR